MPNPYFNLYQTAPESSLIADLYTEAIYNMGFSGNYLPNTNGQAEDLIYGDDPLKTFTVAYTLDMYLVNTMDYGDEADFFSKFGLEVRNQIKVQISAKAFAKHVGVFPQPRGGDLIFIPFFKDTGELFEIKFVNTSKDLYTLGRTAPYYYELSLEPFKYNDESIETGIDSIDAIEYLEKFKTTLDFTSGTGNFEVGEIVYQGTANAHIASAEVGYWDPDFTLLQVFDVTGEFSTLSSVPVIGSISNASYTLTDVNYSLEKQFDNEALKNEAVKFIDTSIGDSTGSLSY